MAWTPHRDLGYHQWILEGRRIGAIGRGSQWWIGDWLLYGAAKWGERYVEAAKITGYDVGSLRNMASLASQFDLSRRRDNLTWCHHAAVASLSPQEQDVWLDRAVTLRLSVADLRLELKAARRDCEQVTDCVPSQPPDPPDPDGIFCPNCGYLVPVSTDPEAVAQLGSLNNMSRSADI